MTNGEPAAIYMDKREARIAGIPTPDEIGVFLGTEAATLLLVDLAAERLDPPCQDAECEACHMMATLWWSVYYALPVESRHNVKRVVDDAGGTIPFHKVHHPR